MMPACDVLIKEIADCLTAQVKSRKVPRSFYVSEGVVVPEANCTQVGSRGNIFVFHVEVKSTDFNAGIRESINRALAEKWKTSIVLFEFTGSNDTDIVCNVPGSGRVPIESRFASVTQDGLQLSRAIQLIKDLSSKGLSSRELLHEFCWALPRKLKRTSLRVDPNDLDPLFHSQIRRELHKPLARKEKLLSTLEKLESDEHNQQYLEKLLTHQSKTVWRVAANRTPVGCELSDFFQLGLVTVLQKYKKYESGRSHFTSWMGTKVLSACMRYHAGTSMFFASPVDLCQEISVDRHGEAEARSYRKSRFSRDYLSRVAQVVSNSKNWDETALDDQPFVLCDFESREISESIKSACDALPEIQKTIVQHRFGLDGAETLTLQELGAIFRITRERVRQLETKALESLCKNKFLKSHHADLN